MVGILELQLAMDQGTRRLGQTRNRPWIQRLPNDSGETIPALCGIIRARHALIQVQVCRRFAKVVGLASLVYPVPCFRHRFCIVGPEDGRCFEQIDSDRPIAFAAEAVLKKIDQPRGPLVRLVGIDSQTARRTAEFRFVRIGSRDRSPVIPESNRAMVILPIKAMQDCTNKVPQALRDGFSRKLDESALGEFSRHVRV